MAKKKFDFAKPVVLTDSDHGCSPVLPGDQLTNLVFERVNPYSKTFKEVPNQNYYVIGHVKENGLKAIVTRKVIEKSGLTPTLGAYQIFGLNMTKDQYRTIRKAVEASM